MPEESRPPLHAHLTRNQRKNRSDAFRLTYHKRYDSFDYKPLHNSFGRKCIEKTKFYELQKNQSLYTFKESAFVIVLREGDFTFVNKNKKISPYYVFPNKFHSKIFSQKKIKTY